MTKLAVRNDVKCTIDVDGETWNPQFWNLARSQSNTNFASTRTYHDYRLILRFEKDNLVNNRVSSTFQTMSPPDAAHVTLTRGNSKRILGYPNNSASTTIDFWCEADTSLTSRKMRFVAELIPDDSDLADFYDEIRDCLNDTFI